MIISGVIIALMTRVISCLTVAKIGRKIGTSKKFRKNFTLTSKFFFVFENFVIFICEKRASKQTKSLYMSRKLKDK